MKNQQKTKYTIVIDTIEDLHEEQRRLLARIRHQEEELRDRMHQLPGELIYAGLDAVVPGFLSGKVTTAAMNFVRSFVNKMFNKEGGGEGEAGGNPKLLNAARQLGLFSLLRLAYRALVKRG